MNIILIAIGGSLGAISRYWVSKRYNAPMPKFPYGTLIANLLGSLLLGWLVGHGVPQTWMLLIGVGFCGALTTFSTLQWEAVQLQKNQQNKLIYVYLGITYSAGLLFATIGYLLGELYITS